MPQENDSTLAKVVGGGLASYVSIDSVLQLLTSDGLYGTIAASNETAGAALSLVFLVIGMIHLGRIVGFLEVGSPR